MTNHILYFTFSQITKQQKNISQIFSIKRELRAGKFRNFKYNDWITVFHGVLPFDFSRI